MPFEDVTLQWYPEPITDPFDEYHQNLNRHWTMLTESYRRDMARSRNYRLRLQVAAIERKEHFETIVKQALAIPPVHIKFIDREDDEVEERRQLTKVLQGIEERNKVLSKITIKFPFKP